MVATFLTKGLGDNRLVLDITIFQKNKMTTQTFQFA